MRRKYCKHRTRIGRRRVSGSSLFELNNFIEEKKLFLKKTEYDWSMIYFCYYKHLIRSFKKSWNINTKISANINSSAVMFLEPVYTFNKQYLAKRTFFNDFLKSNNFAGLQVFRKKNKVNNYYGNVFFLSKYNENFDIKKTFEINDDSKSLFRLKHNFYVEKTTISDNLILYLHFNLNINDIKIIYVIISLNILNKLNKKYI